MVLSTALTRLSFIGLASILTLSACGGGEEQSLGEVATLQVSEAADDADGADAETDDGNELEPDEAALAFSQCMRDEGLDFPDLSIDAEGNIDLRSATQAVDRADPDFRPAMDECREILQQTGFGGGRGQFRESPEFQDALLEFSQCLRDDGYDVGDLDLGQPGQGVGAGAGQGADGQGQGTEGQGQRGQGFGNRGARFAESLDLDYEDPAVAEAVDGCMTVIDGALAGLGVTQGS